MRTQRRRQVCILLPNKQHLDCTVGVKARGHELLTGLLKQLGVGDLQVFSLAVLRDNEYLFLDLGQKLRKYFGKSWSRGSTTVPFITFLRVQHYVENGQLILSSRVQQLYYTELRQKVLHSESHHQEALFFQLAASALQAEVGDLEQREGNEEEKEQRQERLRRCYFLPEDYFPSWLIKRRGRDYLLQHCPLLHGELRGISQRQAVLQFIKEASSLQDGAVTFYRMRQEKKELKSSIHLGVTVKGVHIYQGVEGKLCPLYNFSWTEIDRFTFQGSRFEIAAVGSLCLPKLVYYTQSAFHSKHVLKHLSDCHRVHINTRDAVNYISQLEDMQGQQAHLLHVTTSRQFYKEAYICDMSRLRQRLQSRSQTSSTSDCSVAVGSITAWYREEDGEDEGSVTEFEFCSDESEEVFVDNPAEVSWLAELVHGVSVDGPLALPAPWTAVTMEMMQFLRGTADEGVSVD
ncbi:FERM domain-containing protein 6-like [Echeneis naucrates]|uniref:FERM domain-containing protein 6-like n=1 Tax=Echeneis naucrates TaxID=173247 RepID=UPI0011144F8F|nr:FERM domain-containing protein 6-like [Echeneis naucrates]